MNIHKQLAFISLVLFSAGIFIIAVPLGLSWLGQFQALGSVSAMHKPLGTSYQSALNDKLDIIKGVPRHINIPSLGIDTDVVDGLYDSRNGSWTLSEDTAFYATITNPANSDSGNTFIYGHNSQKIFGKLLSIQNSAEVIITTDNNYMFTYVYLNTEAVKPTDVFTLDYSGKPRLTLQTCSGIWNQTRQMFYFELKNYHKLG